MVIIARIATVLIWISAAGLAMILLRRFWIIRYNRNVEYVLYRKRIGGTPDWFKLMNLCGIFFYAYFAFIGGPPRDQQIMWLTVIFTFVAHMYEPDIRGSV